MKLSKNPHSHEFTNKLGHGSFCEAWSNPDLSLSELIVSGILTADEKTKTPVRKIDFSKDIMITSTLAASRRCSKFYPELIRKRLDTTNGTEYIYGSKVYRTSGSDNKDCYLFRTLYYLLRSADLHILLFENKYDDARTYLLNNIVLTRTNINDIENLIQALRIIGLVANSYKEKYGVEYWHFDLRRANIASDMQGKLILLDPIYAVGDEIGLFQAWRDFGVPNVSFKKYMLAIND